MNAVSIPMQLLSISRIVIREVLQKYGLTPEILSSKEIIGTLDSDDDHMQPDPETVTPDSGTNLIRSAKYHKVLLYFPGKNPENHVVYIADSSLKSSFIHGLKKAQHSDSPEKTDCLLITFSEKDPEGCCFSAFEILQEYLMRLYQWDASFKNILYRQGSVREYADLLYAFFQSPLTIHDDNYAILARAGERKSLFPTEYYPSIGYDVYAASLINRWLQDPEYVKTLKTTGAHWMQNPDYEKAHKAGGAGQLPSPESEKAHKPSVIQPQSDQYGGLSLYMNLFRESGKWVGRIILHPGEHPLTEADRELLEHFASFLTDLMPVRNSISLLIDQSLQEELKAALLESPVPDLSLSSMHPALFDLFHWKKDDRYVAVSLIPSDPALFQMAHMDANACASIEEELNGARVFPFRKGIAGLVNLPRSGYSYQQLRQTLFSLARKNHMLIGVSLTFKQLEKFPLYFLQADEGLRILPKGQESGSLFFGDHLLWHMFDTLKKSPLFPGIYSEELRTLVDYDRIHGTNLYETLAVHLENERSIKQTASHFGINRTTVNFRLERIRLLTGLDLDDPDKRLLLRMMIRLARMKE